jgi:hypothetical protein
MSKIKVSKCITFISIGLIAVLLLILILVTLKNKNANDEKIEFIQIHPDEDYISYTGTHHITRHYMIINPPEDLEELKKVGERFYKENFYLEDLSDYENTYFTMFFYRESRYLPRNWEPNEGYFDVDRIEYHKDDMIMAIFDGRNFSGKIRYYSLKRSKGIFNYGDIVEELEYEE